VITLTMQSIPCSASTACLPAPGHAQLGRRYVVCWLIVRSLAAVTSDSPRGPVLAAQIFQLLRQSAARRTLAELLKLQTTRLSSGKAPL